MTDIDTYQMALLESLVSVPYNSASQFHTYVAHNPPAPEFGVACVLQSQDVTERAEAAGAPKAALLQNGRHVAAVFREEGHLVVLDPYLLHTVPLVVPLDGGTGGRVVTVPAVPIREDRDGNDVTGRLVAEYFERPASDRFTLTLDYFRFSPSRQAEVLNRHFKLDSRHLMNQHMSEDEVNSLLTHPEQTSLSIRVVGRDEFDLAEAILPLHDWQHLSASSAPLFVRDNQGRVFRGGSPEASPVWRAIHRAAGLDRADVEAHLREAFEIYSNVADPKVRIAPYRLENE